MRVRTERGAHVDELDDDTGAVAVHRPGELGISLVM